MREGSLRGVLRLVDQEGAAALWRRLEGTRPRWREACVRALAPLRFAGAALLAALFSRACFFGELQRVEVTPFSFDPGLSTSLQLAYWAREDLQVVYACALYTLPVALLHALLGWVEPQRRRPWLTRTGHVLAALALTTIGLLHGLYYKVAFVMHVQLDYRLVEEAMQNGFGFADFSEYFAPTDALLIAAPALSYWVLRASSVRGRVLQGLGLAMVVGAVLTIPDPGLRAPRQPLCVNPVAFFVENLVTTWNKPKPFAELDVDPSPDDLAKLHLSEISTRPPPETATSSAGDVSVVVVIMESVGRRYAFAQHDGPIMPRLSDLRDRSLFFGGHMSPSNSSGNSLFSFFTGVYPSPSRAVFATQPDVHLPVLPDYMPWIRDRFLVTAGRVNSYFPRGLLKNANVEMRDRYNLELKERRPYPGLWAADERDGVDAFLGRLERAQAPFFGVYYSYAAHNVYYDHGPEFRIMPDLGNEFHRYNNNLRLLDTQLERILAAIRARPERTLLVVLGDHGEAFGQHPGNRKHSGNSYQENLETFAMIHLPGTFPERALEERTVHVDLIPTILGGLGIAYDQAHFQGRNVLTQPAPPYLFFYGNEDTLSSIATSGVKLQLRYGKDSCRVFDLSVDPEEQRPIACGPYSEQARYTGMFHAFQPKALRRSQARLDPE